MSNLFIDCDCHGELLRIEKHSDNDWYFSMWQNGYITDKMRLRDRIKSCWFILTRGKQPYSDMLIFENDKIKKIVDFLKE